VQPAGRHSDRAGSHQPERVTQQSGPGCIIDWLERGEPLELPHPEFFPGQHILVWAGPVLSPQQRLQLEHWQKQGYSITAHGLAEAA